MEEMWGLEDYSDGTPTYSRDIICGKTVNEEEAGGKATYLGVTYYFCSPECKETFEEHPGQYTGVMRAGSPV
jgi:YHS domain-containing protein